MLRCLIVDDSRLFLDAARGLLETQGVAVVGVASTSAEAVRQVDELSPDVALIDVDFGAESGFELVRRLDQEGSGAPRMILISIHAEQDFADLIAASPAIGFITKSELSVRAIQDLLDMPGDHPEERDPIIEPRGT